MSTPFGFFSLAHIFLIASRHFPSHQSRPGFGSPSIPAAFSFLPTSPALAPAFALLINPCGIFHSSDLSHSCPGISPSINAHGIFLPSNLSRSHLGICPPINPSGICSRLPIFVISCWIFPDTLENFVFTFLGVLPALFGIYIYIYFPFLFISSTSQ
jgi:hypothetical protein